MCDHFLAIEYDHVAVPQLVIPFTHACVGGIAFSKIHWLKDLERSPSVVHEDFDIQVSAVIAIHGESTRLRQRINDCRMSVVVAALLHTTKAELTYGLQRVTVQYDFIYSTVVVMEPRQRSDCAIHHGAVETGCDSCGDSISENFHLLLHVCGVLLEFLQKASVLKAYNTSRVLL